MSTKRWTRDDIGDQTGRVAIVTGANSGIGKEAARQLARKGATVVLACRSEARGRAALDELGAEGHPGELALMALDLGSLQSVRDFAAAFPARHDRLDLLINNAGVMVPPASKTADGFELQFGVNHLGHFALTALLFDRLRATAGSRVVTVSSMAHRFGKMDFDDPSFEARGYKPWAAYGQSKLANLLFTFELQRRLDAAGIDTKALAAHPGWTNTDLQRNSGMGRVLNPIVAMATWQGALPTLRAATDPDAEGGQYYGPRGLTGMRGYPVPVGTKKAARSEEDARRLWELSEELTGVRFVVTGTEEGA